MLKARPLVVKVQGALISFKQAGTYEGGMHAGADCCSGGTGGKRELTHMDAGMSVSTSTLNALYHQASAQTEIQSDSSALHTSAIVDLR